MHTIDIIRVALLITLPITLVAVLYRKFKRRTLREDMPAPLHAELLRLEVAYHPARLRAFVKVPAAEVIGSALLDAGHREIRSWDPRPMPPGEHWIEHPLEDQGDGLYFFQLNTTSQRTVRQFHLRRA